MLKTCLKQCGSADTVVRGQNGTVRTCCAVTGHRAVATLRHEEAIASSLYDR